PRPFTVSLFPRKERRVDNMKPKHPDEQEIPFRLRELIRSREAMKCPGLGKKRVAGRTRRICYGASPCSPSAPQALAVMWLFRFQKKKLEKARKKKEEKKEAMLEKNLFKDTVAFGEVVTQPPTITSRPRGQGPTKQAGRKQLLLTSQLGQSQVSPAPPVMSMARQRILEEERVRVVQAYRDIQRRKQLERERAQ
ncbi:Coiled-coil domain-containing protein 137, partial [Acanthisitta chloris]